MSVATVGLDIAKQFFQVHGVDANGRVVLRKKLRRSQVAAFFANYRCARAATNRKSESENPNSSFDP
jgi:transposase